MDFYLFSFLNINFLLKKILNKSLLASLGTGLSNLYHPKKYLDTFPQNRKPLKPQ